jgi:hypothetical protein
MKTTKQVIEQSAIPAKLVRAVVRQLNGKGQIDWQDTHSNLSDITNHGIDGGFNGFIYTRDTVAFFKRNRKEIIEFVKQEATELGEPVIDMVARFNCLGGPASGIGKEQLAEYTESVVRCLYGRMIDDDFNVANALTWFAAEEVARAFCDE